MVMHYIKGFPEDLNSSEAKTLSKEAAAARKLSGELLDTPNEKQASAVINHEIYTTDTVA